MSAKKPRTPCLECGNEPASALYTYCSNTCQQEYQYQIYIQKWKAGEVIGLQRQGVVSSHVKKYLRAKYRNKCCVCAWSEVNPVTGKVPLVTDHIDGNWKNNIESNLRLVCPNCDSLSPTCAALNKGNGRSNRSISNRTVAARELIPTSRTRK